MDIVYKALTTTVVKVGDELILARLVNVNLSNASKFLKSV